MKYVDKIILVIIVLLWSALPVWGARPYKTYVIRGYESWDILCEPYTVKKGDHIWEILRRKGCIAEEDFLRFISILKDLNTHIKNLDRIYPDQRILIPLKKMKAKEGVPRPGPRYITIPMIPDILYSTCKVRPGDCLSKIVTTRLGLRMKQIPKEYFETLKRLNPGIKNINRIYPGQRIRIPELASDSEIAMADPPSTMISRKDAGGDKPHPYEIEPEGPVGAGFMPAQESRLDSTALPSQGEGFGRAVSMAVKPLGGTLLQSGNYFFPTGESRDLKLDLSAFPVLELADGRRFVLETEKTVPQGAVRAIRTFWKSLSIIRIDPEATGPAVLDKIFRAMYGEELWQTLDIPMLDEGVNLTLRGDWIFVHKSHKGTPDRHHCITFISHPEERTSAAVREYLAEKNILVSDLLIEPTPTLKNPPKSPFTKGGLSKASPLLKGKIPSGPPLLKEKIPSGPPLLKGGWGDFVEILDDRDQETFVAQCVRAIGYTYDPEVPLSFSYAGSQVQTTGNLIRGGSGLDTVVDFGTLYGEAKSAIEAGGLKVLSIKPEDDGLTIARNILTIIGIPFTESPSFFCANREVFKAISLTIPGLLSSHRDQGRTLLTPAPLQPKILDFLWEKQIRVSKIKSLIIDY